MRVALVTAGEPLPTDRHDIRLHRTGQFASWLATNGHEVDWVTNQFDHFQKKHRSANGTISVAENYRIHLLESRGYERNLSLRRFLDHADLGNSFRAIEHRLGRPDVVLAAMPTIELANEAVRFAHAVGAASVVDIRDLWPDIMIERAPAGVRWLARLALSSLTRLLGSAMRGADGIISQNQAFVDWGLSHAKRTATPLDATIPLGYEFRPLAEAERSNAIAFWKSRGLDLAGSRSPMLAYAGSLSTGADFSAVLTAGDQLRSRSVRVVICGVGEQLESLQRAAETRDHILLPGWCSYAQLRVLLESATVGLIPYRDSVNFANALPNKAGEYLAHGLPLAWSLGTGPLDRYIAENGVGCSYHKSAEVLTKYVEHLLDNPTVLVATQAAARRLFEREFQADTVHQRLLDHLTPATKRHAAAA